MALEFLTSLFRRPLVGLDIGISGVKAVELSGGKTPRLLAYNRVPLPWNTISIDGEIREREVLVDALKKLFASKQFGTKKVVLGVAGNSVITKKISLPKMSQKEVADQLYFEAEQYIPFNLSEVNLDFAILGPSTGTTAGTAMIDVLIVAAKKDYVQALMGAVETAGLIPEIIDNQSFALGNVFEFNYIPGGDSKEMGAAVIVDFGAGSTKFSLVEGDKTTFTRELRMSGVSCTQMLAERLGISFEQAERVKIADSANGEVRPLITEFVSGLVEEIARTLDFCIGQSSERTVQGVYVCGGGSRLLGLMPALESRLSAPIHALNPIQSIAGSGKKMKAQAIQELSYLGAVAIGLSLRYVGDGA